MKTCKTCGIDKPLESFYRSKQGTLGRQAHCKDCRRERFSESRKAKDLAYRIENRDSINARKKSWRQRNPGRDKGGRRRHAHHVVQNAIRRGHIVKPDACEQCERTDTRLNAHHDDYSKPLDVRWLCGSCHGLLHVRGDHARV